MVPAVVVLVGIFVYTTGIFSSIHNVFAKEMNTHATLDAVDHSPQNTPLLSANKNPDPQKAIGGGDILYKDGALISHGPLGAEEITASKSNNGEISVYVVREGDALSQIAQMYGVTTNTILWANDITKATEIKAGDTLVILPIVGVQHTVAKGETLGSIVKKYGADLTEVLSYNDLTSQDTLTVGDELIIPGGELHTQKRPTQAAVPTKTSGKKSTSNFTNPAAGAIKTQGIHGYNGVDLAAALGTAIRAAAGGQVIVSKGAGWNGGYGNYIVIKHDNGTQTLYAHLNSNSVSAGEWVDQGQTIGAMGNTGKSTGVHLHFEVRGGSNPF